MRIGQGRARNNPRRWRMACGMILVLAALWTVAHMQWQTGGDSAVLSASCAKARQGERMAISLPEGQVSVNTATVDELLALQGIGPSLAEAILAEREKNGLFAFAQDLLSVKGIGEKKLAGFWHQLRLE